MTADFGGRPFSFCHYLAVRSAWERLQPEMMVLHYVHLPSGPWWEMARPMLALHQIPSIEGIYGFPASHPAHRADIVRLVALLVMGGVYLDTDVLVLRSFDSLGSPSFAAALEVTSAGELVGLSNAILVAEPGTPFARLCLEGHDPQRSLWQGFRSRGRDHLYVEMSVRYPGMLSGLCPGLLKVLPTASFLSVDWRAESLASLFDGDVQVPKEALALHLWESHAWDKHLMMLTPQSVREGTSTFARLAKPCLPDLAGRPLPVAQPEITPQQRHEMAAMFNSVNWVDSVHRSSLRHRMSRRFRSAMSHVRDVWHAPLQSRVDTLQRRSTSLRPPDSPPSKVPWSRCGSLDGSWELILPHLPDQPCSALILTGADGEPSACNGLAAHPGISCLWVSDSLSRAAELDRWMCRLGIEGRAAYHPLNDPELIRRLAINLFSAPPHLMVCGLTPYLSHHLSMLREHVWLPSLILVSLNPSHGEAFNRALSLHPQLTTQMTGATMNDVIPQLVDLGYRALTGSQDGQFHVYQRESHRHQRPTGQLIPPLRLQSIYADSLTL